MAYSLKANQYSQILKDGKPQNLTFAIAKKLCEFFPNEFEKYTQSYGTLLERINVGNGTYKKYNLAGFIIELDFELGELLTIKIK